jgi:hypothetical protein
MVPATFLRHIREKREKVGTHHVDAIARLLDDQHRTGEVPLPFAKFKPARFTPRGLFHFR